MFSKIGDFVRRHRNKFIATGALAGGVYAAYSFNRYITQLIEQVREKERKQFMERIKREQHFESILSTSDSTIQTSLNEIHKSLQRELDCEEMLERVRTKPENRIDLWDEIKIRLITYGIAAVYAETLLICAMRIQFGIIGGQMLSNTKQNNEQLREVHRRYLEMFKHYQEDGIAELVRVVKSAVVAAFGHIELQQAVGPDDFLLAYNFVKNNVKIIENAPSFLMIDQWMVACSATQAQSANYEILNQMIAETKDILQCSDCLAVLENLVTNGFRGLNVIVQESFALTGVDRCPIVKLLFPLKTVTTRRTNMFVRDALASSCSTNFLANVYEAFCSNPK